METIQEKMGREKFDSMNIENSRSFTLKSSKEIGGKPEVENLAQVCSPVGFPILYHIIKFIHPLTDKAGNDSLSPSYTQIVSQTEGRARG